MRPLRHRIALRPDAGCPVMAHVIQVAILAGAVAVSGAVLAQALVNPRCWAVLRQLLTGKEG